MSWTETAVNMVKAQKPGEVTFGCNSSRMRGAVVGIPASIVAALGWKADEKLKLFVGSGDHEGRIRIEQHAKGEISLRQMKSGGGRIRLGTFARLTANEFAKAACPHLVTGKALDITLPPHALDKPRAVKAA